MLFFSHFAHDGADGNSRNNDDRSDHSPAWRIDLRNLPFFPFSLLCMATMESATGGQWREWRLIGDQPISLSFLVFFFFFSLRIRLEFVPGSLDYISQYVFSTVIL